MPRLSEFLIWFPAIEPSAARVTVVASCDEAAAGLRLRGCLEGPTCAYARTVEGETPLVSEPVAEGIKAEAAVQAGAVLMEPCLWEPDHPFLYHAELELWQGDDRLDERTLSLGVRHLECDANGFRLNGRRLQLAGAAVDAATRLDEETLGGWHSTGAIALAAERVSEGLLHRADRLGVFLIVALPDDLAAADGADGARISEWRLHPSVALWTVGREEHVDAVRRLDATRPIALRTNPAGVLQQTAAHLFAVTGPASEIAGVASRASKPILVWSEDAALPSADVFQDVLAERQEQWAGVPNVAGIVV
jgi:hypothetical protein